MSLYALKNDSGELIDATGTTEETRIENGTFFRALATNPEKLDVASKDGVKAVELVEKPAPAVVSEEEADMLEKAKHNPTLRPSFMITEYSNSHKGYILGNGLEDRLMRAYVNGWTVEKPKRWNVKVPGEFPGGERHYWKTGVDRDVETAKLISTDSRFKFTLAEIEHYGLQDCEKVVVTDSATTTQEATDDAQNS